MGESEQDELGLLGLQSKRIGRWEGLACNIDLLCMLELDLVEWFLKFVGVLLQIGVNDLFFMGFKSNFIDFFLELRFIYLKSNDQIESQSKFKKLKQNTLITTFPLNHVMLAHS